MHAAAAGAAAAAVVTAVDLWLLMGMVPQL
jgi:hypothetical protein